MRSSIHIPLAQAHGGNNGPWRSSTFRRDGGNNGFGGGVGLMVEIMLDLNLGFSHDGDHTTPSPHGYC